MKSIDQLTRTWCWWHVLQFQWHGANQSSLNVKTLKYHWPMYITLKKRNTANSVQQCIERQDIRNINERIRFSLKTLHFYEDFGLDKEIDIMNKHGNNKRFINIQQTQNTKTSKPTNTLYTKHTPKSNQSANQPTSQLTSNKLIFQQEYQFIKRVIWTFMDVHQPKMLPTKSPTSSFSNKWLQWEKSSLLIMSSTRW